MPPFFSVIIPTHSRPRPLADCLDALAGLDYPPERFEVIVVDDGSDVTPQEVVARFQQRLKVNLIAQAPAGPATARNTGAAHAQGQFLAFVDDDCRPAPGWLRSLATHFTTQPERLIGGQTLNALLHNPYSTASQLLIDYLYAYYNSQKVPENLLKARVLRAAPPWGAGAVNRDLRRVEERFQTVSPRHSARFVASNNMALPTELFLGVGGFDSTFPFAAGEDREFCERWLEHGYPITYASDVVVYHAHPLTLRSFWRQHFNYGRGAFRFRAGRARRSRKHVRFEAFSFYLNLVAYPLRQKRPSTARQSFGYRSGLTLRSGYFREVLTVWLLLLSQLANGLGFMREAAGTLGKRSKEQPYASATT